MMARSKKSSEFGGVPGRIAPDPHTPALVSWEQARLNVQTDPADALSSPEAVFEAERQMEGRTGEVPS
jgi:hypothetical protein